MRILHYLARIRVAHGGVVRAVLNLCGGLAARGHDVTLASLDDADVPAAWRRGEPGVPRSVRLPGRLLPLDLLGPRALAALVGEVRAADVLHLHTPWARENLQLATLARLVGTPYVLTLHGMLNDHAMSVRGPKKRAYLRLVGRRLLGGAAVIHSTCGGELVQAAPRLPHRRTVVAPLLMDRRGWMPPPGPELARQRYPFLAGPEAVLLFVGRVHPLKRVHRIVAAAAQLAASGLAVRVVIAGDEVADYGAEVRTTARRLGLESRVHLLGHTRGPLKVSLYQAADVFVHPSEQENFGFVIPEALASELPVVTSRAVDLWPELEASGGVVVVPEATVGALAGAVGGLLADPLERRAMGRRGRDWVWEYLDPGRVSAAYEGLYRQAMGGAS
jgi:glycosyltransferase involved in cell wall biosynthesis